MIDNGLTIRQSRFIAAYAGNATEAAIVAGYSAKTAAEQGTRLLRNVQIATAIQKRERQEVKALVADRIERQERLTAIIRDPEEKTADRIRAIEILGKMNGDFLERAEYSGNFSIRWARPEEVAG